MTDTLTTYLESRSGKSNKFYNIEITQDAGKWVVTAHWGRIGAKGQRQEKSSHIDLASAKYMAERIVRSKISKGYVNVTSDKLKEQLRSALKETNNRKFLSLKRFSDMLE